MGNRGEREREGGGGVIGIRVGVVGVTRRKYSSSDKRRDSPRCNLLHFFLRYISPNTHAL